MWYLVVGLPGGYDRKGLEVPLVSVPPPPVCTYCVCVCVCVCVFAVGVRSSTKIQYNSGGARVAQVRMMYDTPLT